MTDLNTTPTATTSEALSPAELAYFNSGGTDTSGLGIENSSDQGSTPAPAAASPDAGGQANGGTDDEDGAIVLGEDGKARDKASGKYVPHAALHKERERRKQTETELLAMREKTARAEERLAVLNELMNGGDPDKKGAEGAAPAKAASKSALDEEPIDPNEDIFGALEQAQRQNAELRRLAMDRQKQEQEQNAEATLRTSYEADAMAFIQKAPDFGDAYAHLVSGLHRELEALGVSDVNQRNQAIAAQEREIVQRAMASKKSPSEVIYTIAKSRGFTGKAPAGGGQTPAAKIAAIKQGQNATVSLSNAGGSSGEGLTLESLANMSEDEFARISKQLGKQKIRALMGG